VFGERNWDDSGTVQGLDRLLAERPHA